MKTPHAMYSRVRRFNFDWRIKPAYPFTILPAFASK